MDIFAFVGIPRLFFRLIGLEPFHILQPNQPPPKIPIWKNLHLITSLMAMTICVVGYLSLAMRDINHPELFVEVTVVCMYLSFNFLSYSKIITIIRNRSQLSRILTDLSVIFPQSLSARAEYCVEHYVRYSKRLIRSYAIFQMVMINFFNIFPTAEAVLAWCRTGEWRIELPYECWYPVDKYERGWFEVIMLIQFIGSFTVASSAMAADTLVCSILAQFCMHFDHLRFRLRRICPGSDDSEEFAELKICVQVHCHLIELSQMMDNIFDILILFNMMSSVILICVLGFLVSVSSQFTALVKFAMCLFTFVVQVLFISIFGDQFTQSSLGIADAAWECEWYNGSRRFRRGIAIILHRSQKPQYLTAYKFTYVSMNMFTNVMGLSWRFFVLISSVYEG